MSAFGEIAVSKESEYSEKKRETARPELRELDSPRLPSNAEINSKPFSDSSDIFDAALKKFGLTTDSSENGDADSCEPEENKDSETYLQKGDGGIYYEQETGKAYDSIESWEKAQDTLAKRYDSAAKYYEVKAKKEWAQFIDAENNGESDSERWDHYHRSQEYFVKAKEFDDHAKKAHEKLEKGVSYRFDGPAEEAPDKGSSNEVSETKQAIQNKIDGLAREKEVSEELKKQYPPEEGYEVVSEAYLRDADGKIVRDSETGEARRVDFIIVKDGKVVDSIEVTSKTADKTEQSAKEERIRASGGNYVRDNVGNLVEIPSNVQTRIERRD